MSRSSVSTGDPLSAAAYPPMTMNRTPMCVRTPAATTGSNSALNDPSAAEGFQDLGASTRSLGSLRGRELEVLPDQGPIDVVFGRNADRFQLHATGAEQALEGVD